MKIDMTAARGLYVRNPQSESLPAQQDIPAKSSAKQDVSEISHGALTAGKNMLAMKASIHSFVSAQADTGRLEDLKARVANGTYYVPTEALLDAVLGD